MLVKSRVEQPSTSVLSRKWTILLCIGCFCAGIIFTSGSCCAGVYFHLIFDHLEMDLIVYYIECRTLNKTILNLEMGLPAARAAQESVLSGSPLSEDLKNTNSSGKRRYFMVVGINTALSSRRRRESVRATWMPQGSWNEIDPLLQFPLASWIFYFILLQQSEQDHVEGYLELSAKTKTYFATTVSLWDADFYDKVDDDVHVHIATLGETLGRYRKMPRVYIGCMKSGPALAQKGARYHEPEHWKFGEMGNKHVLHKYANEDVSLGAWFIGLDVQHIDDRRLCCGEPPDCEWKAHVGNICVASFDWSCRGICRSVERIEEVHRWSGESENAVYCCVLRITPVGCNSKQSVAAQFLVPSARTRLLSLERALSLCLLTRASILALERASASSLDLKVVFLGSSELFFARASELYVLGFFRSSEDSCARACFWVADLKLRVVGSSEAFYARARFICVWSLERPILCSSEARIYQIAATVFYLTF
ncbi:hypothetical protein HYC85_012053 [Camellia sinensis]|uniref:Hexosyltransferase n=1 Tax=Camellia sinensis TaxID=4442 RepID=A0A7J7HAU9_CAMSI|nr:hypothetical protein HYC85_012053 [Camellia sinensis]